MTTCHVPFCWRQNSETQSKKWKLTRKRREVESDRKINVMVTLWKKSLTTWVSSLESNLWLWTISCCFLCSGGSLMGAAGQQVDTESTGRVKVQTIVDASINFAELSSGCKNCEWDCERPAGGKNSPFCSFSSLLSSNFLPHQRLMALLL